MDVNIFKKYKKSVNMTCSELKSWKSNPCSNKASLNQEPINRNIRLQCKPQSEWTKKDYSDANKTISFIARMKKVQQGKPICNGLSKRDISLKNWGYTN